MEDKLKKMLKIALLTLRAQTEFDQEVKYKAAQLLRYVNYDQLRAFWFYKEDKGITEIKKDTNWRKKHIRLLGRTPTDFAKRNSLHN